MPKRNRTKITGPITVFLTTTLIDWQPLFSNKNILDKVERQLFQLFPCKADALMGYVLMPSHVHLIVGFKCGGIQMCEFMRTFKSLTARFLFPERGSIWMEGFDDFIIRTDEQFAIKLNYIHDNPVRNNLVKLASDWKWSSVRLWLNDEPNPSLTKSWDWLD